MSGISGATSNVKSVGYLGLKNNQTNISVGNNIYNVNNTYNSIDYNNINYNNSFQTVYMYDLKEINGILSGNPIYITRNIIKNSKKALESLPASDDDKETFGNFFIEHGDSKFKVFNDNRINYDKSHGKVIGANTFDHVFAALMPYGSSEGAKYALRAYKQTAFNKKGGFYSQHDENDVKVYKKVERVVDGKKITEIEEAKNPLTQQEYASKYHYNNDKYAEMKQFYHDVGFDRDKGKNIISSFKSNYMFMRDYMSETGGLKGMGQEVKQNMGEGGLKGLIKEGRNANSVRGDKGYIVGYNPKMANVTVYRKGLWNAKDIEHDVIYGKTDKEYKEDLSRIGSGLDGSYANREQYIDSYGRSSGYFGYVDVGDGTAEATLFKQRAEGGFVSSNGYADVHAHGYEEFNFLQAKACANVEFGLDHVNMNAQASVCVASVEAGGRSDFETRIGDCNLHLGGAHIEGDARALEADVKAFVTAGVYQGEDGKYHADAGIRLEANAELCSAGVSGGTDILGIGTTASARVKIGAGVQCNVGFQDGEFKFKIGLAIGVGFEFGGSIDFSGLVNNLSEIWQHLDIKKAALEALDGLEFIADKAVDIVGTIVDAPINMVCSIIEDLPSPGELYDGACAFVAYPIDTICSWIPW